MLDTGYWILGDGRADLKTNATAIRCYTLRYALCPMPTALRRRPIASLFYQSEIPGPELVSKICALTLVLI